MPPGTRLLSEEERVETLRILKQTKIATQNALSQIPLSMRTLSLAKRKEELERKLEEMDNAIKTFSRKKVYVAIEH